MNTLLKAIKEAANQCNEESNPSGIYFGEVLSVKPLSVLVEQKLTLTEEFLTLTHTVKDYYVDITVSHKTEEESAKCVPHKHPYKGTTKEANGPDPHVHDYEGLTEYQTVEEASEKHSHKYKGRKKIMLHHGLKVGEQVVLLRVQGGQNYIIIDRVNDPICEGGWLD